LTEQKRYICSKIVENLKWLEKILSMGNAHERKDVLQIWDTRFCGWISDFKLLVSHWILLKNSNLKPCTDGIA
jgi:hypothetical protein